MLIQRREDARGGEDGAREAEHEFKPSIERLMASEAASEVRSKEVAEKVWQASQIGCKKVDNLDEYLQSVHTPTELGFFWVISTLVIQPRACSTLLTRPSVKAMLAALTPSSPLLPALVKLLTLGRTA